MKKFLNAVRVIAVIVCYTLYEAANVLVIQSGCSEYFPGTQSQGVLLRVPDVTFIFYIKSFRYQASCKLI